MRAAHPGGQVGRAGGSAPTLDFRMDSIGRKKLDHDVPEGASTNPENEVFFITICCLPRGVNQLAKTEIWQVIDETLRVRELAGDIQTRLVLAMPDHLHGLFGFPGAKSMSAVISGFKGWIAKQAGVRWQRDFFVHRVRSWESGFQKAEYIRQNPVRAGWVEKSEDWPFQR
jgi:REP element-mobilizing transposase RayT